MALQAGLNKGGAAKGELVLAIFELANCFRNGWGVKRDPVAAKQVSSRHVVSLLHSIVPVRRAEAEIIGDDASPVSATELTKKIFACLVLRDGCQSWRHR